MTQSKKSKSPEKKGLKHHIQKHMSKIEKKHIRVSIAVLVVIFTTIVVMLIYFSQGPFTMITQTGETITFNLTTQTKVFAIGTVAIVLAALMGTLEYLYITRVKGY
jgi:hypothetical protein